MHPLRLRTTLLLQRGFAAQGRRRCARRVVFLHIPKTAGSSVNAYFKALLGTSWRGQAVTATDAMLCDPAALALARRARFVGGHFGAASLAALRGDAFAFTVLRDPLERLISAWRFFQTHRRGDLHLPFARLEDALASDHPRAVAAFDNVITRHLAGAGPGRLAQGAAGEALVARAAQVLAGLDNVAWQPRFEADLAAILARLGLPPPPAGLCRNVTDDPGRRGRAADRAMPDFPAREVLAPLAARWIALDSRLVEGWRAGADRGAGGGDAGGR